MKHLCTFIVCILVLSCKNYFENEFENELKLKERKYIDKLKCENLNGIICYIKEYEKDFYVIGIIDSTGFERVIGKVKISNFSEARVGDSIRKKSKSFEIEIKKKETKFFSIIDFN